MFVCQWGGHREYEFEVLALELTTHCSRLSYHGGGGAGGGGDGGGDFVLYCIRRGGGIGGGGGLGGVRLYACRKRPVAVSYVRVGSFSMTRCMAAHASGSRLQARTSIALKPPLTRSLVA